MNLSPEAIYKCQYHERPRGRYATNTVAGVKFKSLKRKVPSYAIKSACAGSFRDVWEQLKERFVT